MCVSRKLLAFQVVVSLSKSCKSFVSIDREEAQTTCMRTCTSVGCSPLQQCLAMHCMTVMFADCNESALKCTLLDISVPWHARESLCVLLCAHVSVPEALSSVCVGRGGCAPVTLTVPVAGENRGWVHTQRMTQQV